MMKNLILAIVFCLPFFANGQCPTGTTIYLGSQQDLLDFVTNFPNCKDLDASLVLIGSVNDLSLLSQIESIEGNLAISSTSVLTNLDGLSNLTTVNGMLEIQLNESLTNLNALSSLANDVWAVRIMNNNSLVSIQGLESVTGLNDELYVYGNPLLENLDGLNNLTFLQSHCEIYQNNTLNDISALNNLATINGHLKIHSNPNLSSIQALNNVGSIVSGLEIYNCPSLSVCDIQPVCNFIQNGGTAVINNNASGCNSNAEIEAACPPILNCSVSPSGPLGMWLFLSCTLEHGFAVNTSGFSGTPAFTWDFGDGTTASGSSTLSHTFPATGNYEVCVTASDGNCSNTYCQNVPTANPVPILSSTPSDITIEVTDENNCWNDVYQVNSISYTDDCDPNGLATFATCTRSDGMNLSDPWQVGVTTVTCTATGMSGQTAQTSWTVTIDICNSECAINNEPNFSTFLEKQPNIDQNPYIFDGIVASNGEYVTIGYDVRPLDFNFNNGPELLFIRQDENGNQIQTPLMFTVDDSNIKYFPFFGDGIFLRDVFIEEAFDANGVSQGYYIASTVIFSETASANGTYDVALLFVDEVGQIQWFEILHEEMTQEYARGLTTDQNGNPIVLIDKSTGTNDHQMVFWKYDLTGNNCELVQRPLSNISPMGNYQFHPLAIHKAGGFPNSKIEYSVSGRWEKNGEQFVGVYTLDKDLLLESIFTYDILPNESNEEVVPTSIINVDNDLAVSGFYELPGGLPTSFVITFSPVDASGQTNGAVVWAKEYYDDQTGFTFSQGLKIFDSHLNGNEMLLTGARYLFNVDFPFFMNLQTGDLQYINIFNESDDQADFGSLISLGLDVGENNEYFLFGTMSDDSSRVWTSKLNNAGNLADCNCYNEAEIDVQDITPELILYDQVDQNLLACNLYQPITMLVSDSMNFFACNQSESITPNCGIASCSTDTLILNTGYNHFSNSLYGLYQYDAFWELVEAPIAGLNLPRPAFTIPPFNPGQDWGTQEQTNWISAFPQSEHEDDNEPPLPPYTLQNCFCICEDSTDIDLFMNVYVDDSVSINLMDDDNNIITNLINHAGFRDSVGLGNVDTSLTLPNGTYCISAELRNLGGVAMGLNIQGYLTGGSLIDPICCGNTNGYIVGAKFHDRNCNGTRDNTNSIGSADHEEGLIGWEISLCDVNQNVIATTTTDELGYYVFDDVEPGDYLVKETQQTDWEATNTESQTFHMVTVDTASVVSDINFSNKYTGPIELENDFSCVVPGETIPIRWIGGECDCDIEILYAKCGDPSGTPITTLPNNTGGYDWDVPIGFPNNSFKIILVACNGSETVIGDCFDVMDIDLTYTATVDLCGEIIFQASSTPSGTYSWNFGDASPFGTTSSVVHQYDSEGPYTVTLTVTTMEGCEKSTSFTVSPEHNSIPMVDCPPDITIGINDSTDPSFTGMASAIDDCGIDINISYQDNVSGECPGGGITILRYWNFTNSFGLNIFCTQYIIVECDPTTTSVTGTALQPNGNPICGVMVVLAGDIIDTTFTDENGFYEFPNIPPNSNITITPSLDENHLCGVNQLDIDIIDEHVIGNQLLSTAFEFIAADVNNNGSVAGSDNFFINQLISGSITTFPNNTSWRFVEANHIFLDPTNPSTPPFPEDVSLTPILGNEVVNFTGVKIGDLNNDCTPTCDSCDISIDIMATNITCIGANDATAFATANGGSMPYSYLWNTNANTPDLFNLSAGTYTVTISDTDGCTASATTEIVNPSPLNISLIMSGVTCFDLNNGYIDLSTSGGTPPYTYLWNTGATTEDLIDVPAGSYDVTITDANGCTLIGSSAVVQPDLISVSETITNATCGTSDGMIELNVTGGLPPYTYIWSTGTTSSTISGLSSGTYTVTIIDDPGCDQAQTYTITEDCPCSASVNITGTQNNCDNLEVSANPTGFAGPVTYTWTSPQGNLPVSTNAMTTEIFLTGSSSTVIMCVEVTDNICTIDTCATFEMMAPPPSFVFCHNDITFGTEVFDCISNSDVSELIATSGCPGNSVSVNCVRSDDPNLTLSDPWSLGTTTVICTATDNIFGVSSVCEFTVTVVDNTPPILNCPPDIILPCITNQNGVLYDFDLSNDAFDNCSGQLTITCSPPSGTIFPIGTTTVTCTATDQAGNQSIPCEFNVIVEACPSVCCLDTIGFCNRFDAGYTSYADGCDINLSAVALDSCDNLLVEWGDGSSSNSQNNFEMSHTYSQSGDYEICATASILALDGSICQTKDTCWMVCVECDGCDNPMFSKVWTHTVADLGYSGGQREMGLAIDGNSKLYISGGYTGNANFGDGALPYSDKSDMFWAKYTSDGIIINSFGAGGELNEYATAIEPDVIGDGYYVGGYLTSEEVTLPSTMPNNEQFLGDSKGIFIAKYNGNDELVWAQNFGEAPHSDYAFEILRDITIDPQGNVYLVGRYRHYAINFDDSGDALQSTSFLDGFVAKLSPSGDHLWSMPITGTGHFANVVNAVDTDSDGNVYITGGFGGVVDFDPMGNTPSETGSCLNCHGSYATNMFLARYSPGGMLDWVVNAGASTSDTNTPNSTLQGWDVKVDGNNVYITGEMKGQGTDFNPNDSTNSIILSNAPNDLSTNNYGFLGKYNITDGIADWAFNLALNGRPYGLGIDPQGNVAIAGYFFKAPLDFDPNPNTEFNLFSYARDGFVAKYTPNGELITAMNLYGNGYEELHDIVFDSEGNLYTIGHNASSNLDDDPLSLTNPLLNSGDQADIFFGKYDCNCSSASSSCCDDVEVTLDSIGDCCYAMNLTNNYGFTVSELEIIMNTEDVVFNSSTLAAGYSFNVISDDLLSITHDSGAIPTGNISEVLTFCLDSISGTSPPLTQDITIRWKGLSATDSVFTVLCEEEEVTNCQFISGADCVAFNPMTPNCSNESDRVYTFEFTVTNQSDVQADAIVINSQTPGFTLTQCNVPSIFSETNIIHSFGNNPLMSDATSENICLKIISPELLQEATEVCFTLSLEGGSGNETCCTEAIEYCVMLEPCCTACDRVEVVSETWENGNGDCCYEIDLSNDCANAFFSEVEISILTQDVIFANIQNGNPGEWAFTANNQNNMTLYPHGFYVPTGESENVIKFCLEGGDGTSTVRFDWLVLTDNLNEDSVYCSKELTYECFSDSNNCLNVQLDTITCDTLLEVYNMTLQVDNVSNFNAGELNIISTQGVFAYGGVVILDPELESGLSQEIEITLVPTIFPFEESEFEFDVSIKEIFGGECCQEFEQLIAPVPDCYSIIDATKDLINENQVRVFPNPFTEGFTILFAESNDESLDLTLWDIYGRKILTDKIGIGEKQFQIYPENIAAGVYFLQLQNIDGQSLTRKLVKN